MAKYGFELEVPGPFRLDLTAWALRRRAHNSIDRFDSGVYRRVLSVDGRVLEIGVQQWGGMERPRLVVEAVTRGRVATAAVEIELRRILIRTLGLDVDLTPFYDLAARDDRLTGLAERFKGLRPPRFPTLFEALVNAVACQQLSLTVGIHLLSRLSASYGTAPGGSGPTGFPEPENLAHANPEDLRLLGFSGAKARTIVGLATKVGSGQVDLDSLERLDDDAARQALVTLPGIGRWSAEYAMLRGLGRLQVLPGDDVGARNNLRRRFGLSPSAGYDEMAALSKSWWPYGGLVYFHLLLDALAEGGHVEANPGSDGTIREDVR